MSMSLSVSVSVVVLVVTLAWWCWWLGREKRLGFLCENKHQRAEGEKGCVELLPSLSFKPSHLVSLTFEYML